MKILKILIILALSVAALGLVFWIIYPKKMDVSKISFKTNDGVKIVGDYYPAEGEGAVLLLHQNTMGKESWGDLPAMLTLQGFSVLAIDLRGHGESDMKAADLNDDYRGMNSDVRAAVAFLRAQGKKQVSIVGASIGANLALIQYDEDGIYKVVAISPGLIFKGLDARTAAQRIGMSEDHSRPRILMLVSQEDVYSYNSSKELCALIKEPACRLEVFTGSAHGVTIMESRPDTKHEISNFLSSVAN